MVRFMDSRRSGASRIGISALVVGVIVFVAVGIAVEITFLPKASTSGAATTTATTSSGPAGTVTPSGPVKDAVTSWVADFNTRNVGGLSNFYTSDATVVWSGNAAGLAGTYNGQTNVRILYGSSIGKTLILNASISNYAEKQINQDNVNVSMTLTMIGNSSVVGTLNSIVAVNQDWQYVSSWQIASETWNYQTFTVQFPVSATTFPQWAALKTGQSPALVSEKAFEWNAGPWVAASVYALLFGVLAFGVIKYRERTRNRS